MVHSELVNGRLGLRTTDSTYKGSSFLTVLKFCSITHGIFEELGRYSNKGGSKVCPHCGACKESVEHVVFECTSYESQIKEFLDYLTPRPHIALRKTSAT